MYKVAGSNVFGQWCEDDGIFNHFRELNNLTHNLTKVCWSYNVFQNDEELYISGAFKGEENQYKAISIPDKLKHNDILLSGNDYHLILVGLNCNIYVFDLKTQLYKNVRFVDCTNENGGQIIKVDASNNNCVYLLSDGQVYCGMLPIHLDTRHCDGKVIDAKLGYEHAILLTDSGRVYTWGNGRRLQLGHGDLNNLELPTEVEALAGIKIVKICAGGWHCCVISEFGDLYMWGWNDVGQLGIKEKKETARGFDIPTLVDIFDDGQEIQLNVIDVACGTRHTAILLEDGSVWTTGSNKYGQLGFCTEKHQKINIFTKSYTCAAKSKLICGPWSTIIVGS